MTSKDLLQLFHKQIDQYKSTTNKVVMMLTDSNGSRIHVADLDKLEELSQTLEHYAYTNPGDPNIPRFTHLTCINNDSE